MQSPPAHVIATSPPKEKTLLIVILLVLCINVVLLNGIFFRVILEKKAPVESSIHEGLVLYFPFNNLSAYKENSTFVYDFSSNGNNGKLSGSRASTTQGEFESSGPHEGLTIDDSDSLSPSTFGQHFTISFFVKFTNTDFVGEGSENDYYNYMQKGSFDEGYEWLFRQYNSSNVGGRNNRLSFYAFNPEGGLGAGSYSQEGPIKDEWMYITGVINGTHIKLYKNGVLKSSNPLSEYAIHMENRDAPVNVGKSDEVHYFQGSIDELRMYNFSLNDAQVSELYTYSLGKRVAEK